MEHLEYEVMGGRHRASPDRPYVVVGVVASSNLEVMAEPKSLAGKCKLIVDTKVAGFGDTWKAVFEDFVERNQPADVQFSVNVYRHF